MLLRVARVVGAATGIIFIAVILGWWLTTRPFPGDTWNYVQAGLRLARGEPLYAHVDLGPGYAPVAIFSPPLIGVMFRPIVTMLGVEDAMKTWVVLMAICELVAIGWLVLRTPVVAGPAVAVLSLTIALTIVVGNIDAFVLLMLLVVWRFHRYDRQLTAGGLLGVLTSLKLTPAALVWWALVTGRWRTTAAALAVCAGLAVVTVIGSEPGIFAQFVSVSATNYSGAQGPASLAALGRFLGLEPALAAWLPRLGLVAGLCSVFILRHHPRAAWAAAVCTMVAGSPVAAWHSPALLLAALAPLISRTPSVITGPDAALVIARSQHAE